MKKYQIIYADPPWSYNDKMGNRVDLGSATGTYNTQGLDWIKNLKVSEISDKDCALFIWAVSPLLPEAFEVIEAWGFKYKTVAFVWSKKTINGNKVANMGRWTMGNVEVCLLATKGSPKRASKNVRQLVEDLRAEHSRKPDQVRNRIVELMGDIPRIELFARDHGLKNLWGENRLDGWDKFGNEVESDISLELN